MNYYQARELRDGDGKGIGLWHYTCMNDGRIWPVGNCSPWVECDHCKASGLEPAMSDAPYNELPKCRVCNGQRCVRKADPCPGHATPEEACEHQKEYFLDHAQYDHIMADEQRKCEVCGAWTQRVVTWGHGQMSSATLCDAHANREELAKIIRVGECMSSC